MKKFILVAVAAFFLFPNVAQAACTDNKQYVRVMKESYWDKVARCETRSDWQDHGNWGGGLGIYVRTWQRFGGWEFARHPGSATKEEQIIVANRISVLGYQMKNTYRTWEDRVNKRPLFLRPVGFFGWGCIKQSKSLHPDKHRKKKESCPVKLSK
jgi:hypothetical protein